jgi:hypothetical protein
MKAKLMKRKKKRKKKNKYRENICPYDSNVLLKMCDDIAIHYLPV